MPWAPNTQPKDSQLAKVKILQIKKADSKKSSIATHHEHCNICDFYPWDMFQHVNSSSKADRSRQPSSQGGRS